MFNELTIVSAVAIVGGLYLFIRGFGLLARKRLVLNTPSSKIRSASLGLVEIGGVAAGPYTVPAPISGKACFLYETTVWQQHESGKGRGWEKVAKESLHVPFFLDDGTGRLLIAPRGAELDLHRDLRKEYNASFFWPTDDVPAAVQSFLIRHAVDSHRAIRVEERCVKPQDALFVFGTLSENPGIEASPLRHNAEAGAEVNSNSVMGSLRSLPAPLPVVVRLSEPGISSGPDMSQQSRIAAALTKAGITNPGVWAAAGVSCSATVDAAPRVTEVSVSSNTQVDKPEPPATFDLKPPVVVMKGENNSAFLISWRSRQDVVRSLARKSTALIWLGAALALLGAYVLLAQFELL
jgi:hypothetical protein